MTIISSFTIHPVSTINAMTKFLAKIDQLGAFPPITIIISIYI